MDDRKGAAIHITGIVQGVGFRPFVYNLAQRCGLTGWVQNTSAGVNIQVDGPAEALAQFTRALTAEAPPMAHIDRCEWVETPANGFSSFEIILSEAIPGAFQPISPDVCICDDCLRELFDPADRRYRYPFINCTNCGPRFTIICDIPYDRPATTMAGFKLCPDCEQEYHNPADRRFHAQPVACPRCGPQVWLESSSGLPGARGADAMRQARRLLAEGKILAIKGLGGFHLACDATNRQAVSELRRRKLRVDKPFALMAGDLETVRAHCHLTPAEVSLLQGRERPIVILRKKPASSICSEVAPGQEHVGFMLPYTPLHYLLLSPPPADTSKLDEEYCPVLVMTSGNLSEEPIATDNDEARTRLAGLCDAFLMHDRPIHVRCDDSVMRTLPQDLAEENDLGLPHPIIEEESSLIPLRRSRGYAPYPVHLLRELPPVLAAGAQLKNTFCLTRGEYAFLSHHIGDLENLETLESFEQGVAHFEHLFRIQPQALAYDLHPDYLSTRYVLERAARHNLPSVGVQHHHAHIAACMVENRQPADQPVIGLAFDGTGFGSDGAIWGGEVLLSTYTGFERLAHLQPIPLPGGDAAVKEPWRVTLAWLASVGIPWSDDLAPVEYVRRQEQPALRLQALRHQVEQRVNAPLTTSLGRLFDAAAALAGLRPVVNYEAQAAIEFEALLDPTETALYSCDLDTRQSPWVFSPAPLFTAMLADLRQGVDLPRVSARFHNGAANLAARVCIQARAQTGIQTVALSGGVWQNMALLTKTIAALRKQNFKILIHHKAPCNDGGLALGQAVVAQFRLAAGI